MFEDRWYSQNVYEAKPVLLILVGTSLLVMFDARFEFSGLLLIIAGTLIARMRLGWRLYQDSARQRRRSQVRYS